jgi:putative multiple sugar transport system substrate-binding protein
MQNYQIFVRSNYYSFVLNYSWLNTKYYLGGSIVKKHLKLFEIIITMFVLAAFVSGCGSSSSSSADGSKKSSGTVDIGIVLPTKDEPRWIQDETRFNDALKGTNYKSEILFSQGSSAKEKENVDALVAKGIKVLIICSQDGAAAAASVESAKKNGVKVISYDRLITGTDAVDYYVSFDSKAVGAVQAKYLVDHASGIPGQPLYLYAGAASDNNAFLFFEGAWKVLQPKIADGTFKVANSSEAVTLKGKQELSREEIAKIIGQVTTNWDFNTAKNKAQSNLTSASADSKGAVLVLAPNDGTARSIADTFKADTGIKSYVITGQDAEKPSIQYIIDGKQSMTVFKDVRTLVKDSIAMSISLLKNETPTTEAVTNNEKTDVKTKQTSVISVDKANVKQAIIDSGYYQASDFTGL